MWKYMSHLLKFEPWLRHYRKQKGENFVVVLDHYGL